MRVRAFSKTLGLSMFFAACLMGVAAPSSAYIGIQYRVDCAQYADSIHHGSGSEMKTDEEALRDSPLHIYELEELSGKCKDDSPIAKALKGFFVYKNAQGQADGPIGTDLSPGMTTAQHAAEADSHQAGLKKMLEGFKKGDTSELMMVLRYMVWQTDDNNYANAACEIVRRAFPDHYDELKPLTRDGSLERKAWDFNKWRWNPDGSDKMRN